MPIDEVKSLPSPDVEVLVIGTGWHGAVNVESAVQELEGIQVYVFRTPAAYELLNQYASDGKTVVPIAHSTC